MDQNEFDKRLKDWSGETVKLLEFVNKHLDDKYFDTEEGEAMLGALANVSKGGMLISLLTVNRSLGKILGKALE